MRREIGGGRQKRVPIDMDPALFHGKQTCRGLGVHIDLQTMRRDSAVKMCRNSGDVVRHMELGRCEAAVANTTGCKHFKNSSF